MLKNSSKILTSQKDKMQCSDCYETLSQARIVLLRYRSTTDPVVGPDMRCSFLPVGWAVGSLAGATQGGRVKKSQSEHHRAVIPLDGAVRRDSENILRAHGAHQNGGLRCCEKLSGNSWLAT